MIPANPPYDYGIYMEFLRVLVNELRGDFEGMPLPSRETGGPIGIGQYSDTEIRPRVALLLDMYCKRKGCIY